MTKEIFQFYIKNVYNEYIKDVTGIEGFESFLILDQATAHLGDECKSICFLNSINISYIPKGLTSICQPLDVSVNGPFIKRIKNEYIQCLCNKEIGSNEKVTRNDVVKWITKCWYDDSDLEAEKIRKNFLYCGISNSLDGSQDNEIRIWKWLKDKLPINTISNIEEVKKEEIQLDNDCYLD